MGTLTVNANLLGLRTHVLTQNIDSYRQNISSILHVVVIETIYGYFHITSVLIDIYGYLYYRRLFIDIRVLVLHWVLTIGG